MIDSGRDERSRRLLRGGGGLAKRSPADVTKTTITVMSRQPFDQGLMDMFPASVGTGSNSFCAPMYAWGKDKGLVMGYFDGNTVTALWNYAQQYAMSDNSYGTTFGPSTPGLLNLVAGNTYPATVTKNSTTRYCRD